MKLIALFIILVSLAPPILAYDSTAVDEMTFIREDAPTNNYGSNTIAEQYSYGVAVSRNDLLRFDETAITIPNDSVFAACTMFVYCATVLVGSPDPQAYQSLRDWTEGGATWSTYNGSDSWTTGGGEGSGTDRAATAMSTFTPSAASWVKIPIDSTVAAGWFASTITNNGILLWDAAPNNWAITYHTDDGTNKPYVLVYFAEAPVTSQVIITE